MKRINSFIIEKLKTPGRKVNITASKFINAFFSYLENTDSSEITALDILWRC